MKPRKFGSDMSVKRGGTGGERRFVFGLIKGTTRSGFYSSNKCSSNQYLGKARVERRNVVANDMCADTCVEGL